MSLSEKKKKIITKIRKKNTAIYCIHITILLLIKLNGQMMSRTTKISGDRSDAFN